MSSIVSTALTDLTAHFNGQLLQANDPGYDDARRVHNGMIGRPRETGDHTGPRKRQRVAQLRARHDDRSGPVCEQLPETDDVSAHERIRRSERRWLALID